MKEPVDQVLKQYELGNRYRVLPAGGTAGKCWRVETDVGVYFLRRRGVRTSSQEALAFDHGLRRHLVAGGVPTAEAIPARSGDLWLRTDSGVFELYPFIQGLLFDQNSEPQLAQTGQALAQFHRVAATYDQRGQYNPAGRQFAVAVPEVGGSDRLDDPRLILAALQGIARKADSPDRLAGCLSQAQALSREYDQGVYDALPKWLIHGDYHPGNLLFPILEGEVAGIFDLDWAVEHTRCRDLADGLYFFAARREADLDGSDIESLTAAAQLDLGRCLIFLRAYMQIAPLEPEEIRAIPLALKARWLSARLEGMAKVPEEERIDFLLRDIEMPLRWLDENEEKLIEIMDKE